MKLAFCLYRYFPFGGLQRDFLRIARLCVQRGHEVTVYTGDWEGEPEPQLRVEILPVSGWQNHSRCRSFARELAQRLQHQAHDLVIGFNKMPGLDVYYAADVCYQTRFKNNKPFWFAALPRYRQYLKEEQAVFGAQARPRILTLAAKQQEEYRTAYGLPAERFHLLPPGISLDRKAPPHAETVREELRQELGVSATDLLLLAVGSGFKTKGLDRTLKAMSALPDSLKKRVRLWVIGQDNPRPFLKLANSLALASQVTFLGGRHDVARFFLAADLLVHPAYHENTGTVILEALVAGLPILTVDVCGYAPYVLQAQAGKVLPSPFKQTDFDQALLDVLLSPQRSEWKANALAFAETADIYSLPEKAVDFFESLAESCHPERREGSQSSLAERSFASLRMTEGGTVATEGGKAAFEEFMQLRGEVFREQKGRRTQRVFLNQQSYFLKQHFGVGWWEICKNLLQLKWPVLGATNEYRALLRLQELSILAPRVKAYGCRGLNPARRRSFLLMDELKGLISLEDFCRDWKKQPPSFALKTALIRKVAHIAQVLHENGLNHRDFYLCHFLLDPESLTASSCGLSAGSIAVYLIDLHRAGQYPHLPQRWRLKDLAGLYFSSKDQGLTTRDYWRFIKAYRQKPLRVIIEEEKKFWHKVILRGDRLYHAHA